MLEVKLEPGAWIRRQCLVCGGSTNKDYVQARVYEDGEDTHRVVCQACLALSSVDRAAQLQRHAQELRELAAAMDTEAEALPPMPSHAEWTAANAEAEAEYLRDLNPEERARLDAELEDWTHDQSAKPVRTPDA